MSFRINDDEDLTVNDLSNTEVPTEVHTIRVRNSVPDRSVIEEDLPLDEMEVNNLSPLKKERLKKSLIKKTKRGGDLSTKEATKIIEEGDTWKVVHDSLVGLKQQMVQVIKIVQVFNGYPDDILERAGVTRQDLKRYTGDIQFISQKIHGVNIPRKAGKVTIDSFIHFNAAMTTIQTLTEDFVKLILPVVSTLTLAQHTVVQNSKKQLQEVLPNE
jgi:hypothetical protein